MHSHIGGGLVDDGSDRQAQGLEVELQGHGVTHSRSRALAEVSVARLTSMIKISHSSGWTRTRANSCWQKRSGSCPLIMLWGKAGQKGPVVGRGGEWFARLVQGPMLQGRGIVLRR
jgi:hypothetical protein